MSATIAPAPYTRDVFVAPGPAAPAGAADSEVPFVSLAAPPDPAHRPKRATPVLGVLAGGAVGAAVGFGGMWAAERVLGRIPTLPRAAEVAMLLLLPVAFFAVVLAHELGHLLAGRLAGTRAQMLVVGPLMVVRTADGWRTRLNRAVNLAGGLAVTAPHGDMAADPERARRAMRTVVLGGPAASFVFAGLAALAAWAGAAPGAGAARLTWVAACAATAVLSAGIGLVCLLPMRAGGLDTDGRQALDLRPGAPGARRKAALIALVGLDLAGTRPRDYPAALVDALVRERDAASPTGELFARYIAASHAFDAGRPAEGRARLAESLAMREVLAKPLRGGTLLEGAWVAARHDGDVDGARALVAEADAAGPGLNLTPYLRPMAEAALAWRAGEREAARRHLDDARRALAAAPALSSMAGSAALVRDRIDALAADLDAGR